MWVTFFEGCNFLQRVSFFCNRCHFFVTGVIFIAQVPFFFAHQCINKRVGYWWHFCQLQAHIQHCYRKQRRHHLLLQTNPLRNSVRLQIQLLKDWRKTWSEGLPAWSNQCDVPKRHPWRVLWYISMSFRRKHRDVVPHLQRSRGRSDIQIFWENYWFRPNFLQISCYKDSLSHKYLRCGD